MVYTPTNFGAENVPKGEIKVIASLNYAHSPFTWNNMYFKCNMLKNIT